MRPLRLSHPATVATLLGLMAVLAWDLLGQDIALARLAGSPSGFPAREAWFLTRILHDGARALAGVLVAVLVVSVAWPLGPLRALTRGRRLWLLAVVIGGMLLPAALKRVSATSCPWELAEFGGSAALVSHWQWWALDGGPGHCFPAGHASAGFAWIAGFFAWPASSPWARRWLWGALAAGLLLGVAQQLRGAHFMSHTLWTAWICWTWAWGLSLFLSQDPQTTAGG